MANRTDLDVRNGSSTKIRAEQIKSELALGTLAGDIEALSEQLANIIGAEWKEELASYTNVQLMDLAKHLDASDANKIRVIKHLDVDGQITGSAARVENLTAAKGALVFATTGGDLFNSADLKFESGKLQVVGEISGSSHVLAGGNATVAGSATVGGPATLNGGLTVNGSAADFNNDVTANKISIDGDTVGRVYRVGPSGEIFDDMDLTIAAHPTPGAGSVLSLKGELSASAAVKGASLAIVGAGTFGGNVSMMDLTAQDGSFSGDLQVTGDLKVQGAMTYLDTQNLLVKDAKVVISSGSLVDGAGIYLGNENAGENIRWDLAGDKWVASDKFAADTLQALDLSSAIVYADASGNLVEVTAAQFAGYLAAGFGIDSVTDGTIAATEYTAGTGMHKTGFEFYIGQAVETNSNVQFGSVISTGVVSGSALKSAVKSAEYMYADADGELKAGAFQASGADMVIADSLGSVTYSLKFAISGSGAAATISDTNYMADDLSVFEALRSLDAQLKVVTDTAAASSKKATATVGVAGYAADAPMQAALSSNFIDELTAANSMIFVNGQLMLATADYALDAGAKTLAFKFALEEGDVVVVQKA